MKSLDNSITASHFLRNTRVVRLGLLIILPAILGVSFIASSSASRYGKGLRDTLASGVAQSVPAVSGERLLNPLFSSNVAPIGLLSEVMPQPAPTPGAESVATYEADCTTARQNFTVDADTHDVTVCAKAENLVEPRKIYWVNPAGNVVQIDDVSPAGPTTASRVISALGNWKAYLVDSADGSARAIYSFTVSDAALPRFDLSVIKNTAGGSVTSGGPINYQITVTNNGPDTASGVQLTDTFPDSISYADSSQDSGPIFTPVQTTPTTIYSIGSLPPGATATFTFIYTVNGTVGTVISNTAVVTDVTTGTATPAETHSADNTWTTSDTVVSGGGEATCSIDCPNSITVTATTSGEGGGAVVDYDAPEAFGTCGTVEMSQASHTFFPIGETIVTATATGGGFCSFTVTVIDSPAPVITSCPGDITVTANSGESQAFVPLPSGTSSDPGTPTATGDNVIITGGRSDGEGLAAAYPVGETTITWTATECTDPPLCENPFVRSASCEQTITVLDPDPLTITCPTNKTFNAPGGSCVFTATAAQIGTATKSPASATLTSTRSDGAALLAPFPAGITAITWTATATDGRTTSCTQIITVHGSDNTPPVLTIPADLNVTTDTCSALLDDELGVATASDNCSSVSISRTGIPTVSCPPNPNPCESFVFPAGQTTNIVYTATDSNGNSVTKVQHVTVTALNPPEVAGQVWLGLKTSSDVGTKFDLRAEVYKNGGLVGSSEVYDLAGGSSGFNNAVQRAIDVCNQTTNFGTGDILGIKLLVRVAATSGHISGTARLWYNDSAANSRFTVIVNGSPTVYYLRKIGPDLVLDGSTGPLPKLTSDVLVNRNQNGNPFKSFGIWTKTF